MRGLPSLRALDEDGASGPRWRLWLALEPTDMRCGFDRLAERVRAVIGQDALSGQGFIFRSRRGDRLKLLTWDRVRDKSVRVTRPGPGGSPSNPRIYHSSDGSEER